MSLTFLCKLITKATGVSFQSVYSSILCFFFSISLGLFLFCFHALHSLRLCVHTILFHFLPFSPIFAPSVLCLKNFFQQLILTYCICFCPTSLGGFTDFVLMGSSLFQARTRALATCICVLLTFFFKCIPLDWYHEQAIIPTAIAEGCVPAVLLLFYFWVKDGASIFFLSTNPLKRPKI